MSATRTRDAAELYELRSGIISHIRSHGPITSTEIREALGYEKSFLDHHLRACSEMGCIRPTNDGGKRGWVFVQTIAASALPRTPTVGTKAQHKFCKPGPVITKIKDGVKYTYHAAPPPRFHVELPPGGGVISYDHPRLTAALIGASA
jgi:hypothetical protein